ncbi:hypothetical protein MXB_1119 [Myxobolus squamalis]|nr:hypothetical protein MXB_1119 [Myxobolus squamalis]
MFFIFTHKFLKSGPIFNGIDNDTLYIGIVTLFLIIFAFIWISFFYYRDRGYVITNAEEETETRRIEGEELCPICQQILNLVYIETSCNHQFCGFQISNSS